MYPLTREQLLQLKVSDVKQYLYCPRVIYFTYVVPVKKKTTFKMEEGREQQVELDRLEKRRKLVRYGLLEGERISQVPLYSERLGLRGVLDMLIRTPGGDFPVEVKHTTRRLSVNHKYQLVAYAMLVEAQYERPVRAGFVYLIPGDRIQAVLVTHNARVHVKRVLGSIRNLVARGNMPSRTRSLGRCRDCEYRRFCADVA